MPNQMLPLLITLMMLVRIMHGCWSEYFKLSHQPMWIMMMLAEQYGTNYKSKFVIALQHNMCWLHVNVFCVAVGQRMGALMSTDCFCAVKWQRTKSRNRMISWCAMEQPLSWCWWCHCATTIWYIQWFMNALKLKHEPEQIIRYVLQML